MQKGKSLILQIKDTIYPKTFQKIHCVGKNSFARTRKLPFPTVFSMILKLQHIS